MKLVTAVLIIGLLLALFANGTVMFLIMLDHHLGRLIYVNKKHMNITVEGCATPTVTLGFYTPIKAGPFMKYNFK